MENKKITTLAQLFIEEYLEKKQNLEELVEENNQLKEKLESVNKIIDDYRKMIDSLKVERYNNCISISGFFGESDKTFNLFELELEKREKMKSAEEDNLTGEEK